MFKFTKKRKGEKHAEKKHRHLKLKGALVKVPMCTHRHIHTCKKRRMINWNVLPGGEGES